jgi:hypothetical protein
MARSALEQVDRYKRYDFPEGAISTFVGDLPDRYRMVFRYPDNPEEAARL